MSAFPDLPNIPVSSSPPPARLPRRALVARLATGAAMVAGVDAALPSAALAAPGGNLVLGTANNAGAATTSLRSKVTGAGEAVFKAVQPAAAGTALRAEVNGGIGLEISDTGSGVGRNQGVGLRVTTSEGTPIVAQVGGGNSSYAPAIYATSTSLGVAVDVVASGYNGLGLRVAGQRAALRLVPQAASGAPNDGLGHDVGEMVVDAAGALYLCVAAGIPGTWRQVALL